MSPLLDHIKQLNQAVAYVRVSTPQQAARNSPECQERAIQAYADHHNIALHWFKDVGSAFRRPLSKRPQAMAALEKARELGVPLIVDTPDRLARNDEDFCDLIAEYGVRIIAAEIGELDPGVLKACVTRAKAESERNSEALKQVYENRDGPLNPDFTSAQQKGRTAISGRAMDRALELEALMLAHGLDGLKPYKLSKALSRLEAFRSDGKAWTEGGVAYSMKLLQASQKQQQPEEAPQPCRRPPKTVSVDEEMRELLVLIGHGSKDEVAGIF